ncbi:MAG: ornithine cyclodeaminase family protein [Candidatus Heimdallarchaeota archaeon]|nr:ornithine cyclodeaminase family protein [Candidatus Heimdallarchaeota archaeon]MCK4769754.1 ornithine cyclodeaminase family protein [Candidatus Heimdallarchaeota archaeon]
MVKVVELEEIERILQRIDPIQIIEDGFIAYSQGKVTVPPVGEMIFENPPGECHIKYGFIKEDDYFVIKVATGFYDNPKLNLPAFDGLMLLFSQKTGQLLSVLLDNGHLTNIRTAAAGAIAAKYMAPKKVKRIGVFGAGTHGRLQPIYLQKVLDCKDIITWGISQDELDVYEKDMKELGFKVETTQEPEDITSTCNLIVTCTPSKEPLIFADQVNEGTHITALGSDTPEKQELDSAILKKADRLIVDSIEQCQLRGESYKAIQNGMIKKEKMIELGDMILKSEWQRQSEEETTVVDLTGVAVQDIQISKAIWESLQ